MTSALHSVAPWKPSAMGQRPDEGVEGGDQVLELFVLGGVVDLGAELDPGQGRRPLLGRG
jgi:hypothetical protein